MTARLKRFEIERQLIRAVNDSVQVEFPLEGLTIQAVGFWIRRNELQTPDRKRVREAVLALSQRLGSVFGESGQEIATKVDQLEADLAMITTEFTAAIRSSESF